MYFGHGEKMLSYAMGSRVLNPKRAKVEESSSPARLPLSQAAGIS
jgi:hypothetical protein